MARAGTKTNGFNHYKAKIEGYDFHFIHEKSKQHGAIPILLLHGWPDSFYRFHKIIDMLTDPASAGITSNISFDVIVPSLPGFGFTTSPQNTIDDQPIRHTARLLHTLMTDVLEYDNYFAVGGDGGSPIAQVLAIEYPNALAGIYITDLGWSNANVDQSTLSKKEKKYLEDGKKQFMKQGAYAMLQSTKPQTLAYGLTDSPVGLASWILDRFYFWCDCNGDIEKSFSKDELLTNITIYWATDTIAPSIRNYRMDMQSPSLTPNDYVSIPVGMGLFPKDIGGVPPREFAERTLNIQHWKEMSSGGHFTAWEQPRAMAEDIFEFTKELYSEKK